MNSDRQPPSPKRFFVKQAILLIITIILVAFFTIPFLEVVARDPADLQVNAERAKQEAAGLLAKIDVTNAKMLMSPGDDEAQEKLKKQVEELQRQMAMKDLENKHLQEQIALVNTMLQLINAKTQAAPAPGMDFWHKAAELAAKLFGCIASIFSGAMFVIGWWRKRSAPTAPGEAAQSAAS